MTIFNRPAFRSFHKEAEKELQALAERHGVTLTQKGGSFNVKNGTIKFEVCSVDANGEALTPEAESFRRYANQFGLEPGDLGGTFVSNDRIFRITGLNPRRPKYPISAERVTDGRSFKFPSGSVNNVQQRA